MTFILPTQTAFKLLNTKGAKMLRQTITFKPLASVSFSYVTTRSADRQAEELNNYAGFKGIQKAIFTCV